MINPGWYIRKRFFTLIDGNVALPTGTIPVYEGEGSNTDPVQIIIGDFSSSGDSSKHHFGSDGTQTIEIVSEQMTGMRRIVDDVAEGVMEQITPTPSASFLSDADATVVIIGGVPSIRTLTEEKGNGAKIVRMILQYRLKIYEN